MTPTDSIVLRSGASYRKTKNVPRDETDDDDPLRFLKPTVKPQSPLLYAVYFIFHLWVSQSLTRVRAPPPPSEPQKQLASGLETRLDQFEEDVTRRVAEHHTLFLRQVVTWGVAAWTLMFLCVLLTLYLLSSPRESTSSSALFSTSPSTTDWTTGGSVTYSS